MHLLFIRLYYFFKHKSLKCNLLTELYLNYFFEFNSTHFIILIFNKFLLSYAMLPYEGIAKNLTYVITACIRIKNHKRLEIVPVCVIFSLEHTLRLSKGPIFGLSKFAEELGACGVEHSL